MAYAPKLCASSLYTNRLSSERVARCAVLCCATKRRAVMFAERSLPRNSLSECAARFQGCDIVLLPNNPPLTEKRRC